jgi:pyruvate/2-oxoglutarate dehydrogenase complex dihydrolipoamide dehydrogenase (E3) component
MGGKVKKYDLIVIGSGAGGGVGANYAAGLGKKVALFEKGEFGGECPNVGCVPTKAILQAAEAYETARSSEFLGIKASPTFSWQAVMDWKDTAVGNTGTKQGKEIFKRAGIDVFQDKANFVSPKRIEAGGQTFQARRFLVASGTKTFIPPIPGLKNSGYITSTEALELQRVPKSILIIGGGAIGCEFAEMFNTFGSKVHIVETLPKLLAREDDEVSQLVKAIFESKGIAVAIGAKVEAISGQGGHKVVHLEKSGHSHRISAEQILVATGKSAVTDFGLDQAKVRFDRKHIVTNSFLQTTNPRIYAAGDIAGPYLFTHTAEYQSQVAVYNAFHRRNRHRVNYRAIPRCTFITPEVASVGSSEQELKEKGVRYKTGAVPLSLIGRSNTSGEDTGLTKIITDKNGIILGGSVVGPRSGEVINELALAIHLGARARDVASAVHAFPTFSETLMYAARSVK